MKVRVYHIILIAYPLWSFGSGQSYTTFEYVDCALSDSVLTDKDQLTVTVKVKNTGKMDGKEVVQLYVRDRFSSVATPMQEVVEPGEFEIQIGSAADNIHFTKVITVKGK